MRGSYETAKRWQEPSRDVRFGSSDTLEFIPTHMLLDKPQMVMELGRTATGMVFVQFDDGSRAKISPRSLRVLDDLGR